MVSVIIPFYNAEDTIIICVESVLQQTYRDFEIIAIDDGSTDHSVPKLTEYINIAKPVQQVQILRQNNQGPSSARNRGIAHAKGDWIAFLDADDYWFPDTLEVQLDALSRIPDACLTGAAYNKKTFSGEHWIKEITFSMLLFRNYFHSPSVVVKREVFSYIHFNPAQKFSEDYRVWLLIASRFKCIYVNKVLSRSITNKKPFGESGLSSQMWKMEKGELSNYRFLYKEKYIGLPLYLCTFTFSFFKYVVRSFILLIK